MTTTVKSFLGQSLAGLGLIVLLGCGGGGGAASYSGGGGNPGVAPAFTSQPAAVAVNSGQSATFSAAATGTPAPSLQWERSPDGSAWSSLAGATGGTLSFAAAKTDHGHQYRARAANASGSVASSPAPLTVFWAPSITSHPANQSVQSPDPAVFSMAMDCNPDASSQWQSSADGLDWHDIPGATAASYSTGPTSGAMNNLRFRCVCTNSIGTATTNAATLTVSAAPVQRTVTFQAGTGGTLSGTLVQAVPNGGSTSAVSALPGSGYTFSNWTGAGFATSTSNPLVIASVQQDLTLTANFAPVAATYTITATAGSYGRISPSGAVTVAAGGSITFSILADSYYSIGDVKVDGVSVGAVDSYTFTSVTGNHTISATFVY